AAASRLDSQLVPGQGDHVVGSRRGIELQCETDAEKGVWVSDTARRKNRLVSPTWGLAGTGVSPQILVRRRIWKSMVFCASCAGLPTTKACSATVRLFLFKVPSTRRMASRSVSTSSRTSVSATLLTV